MNHFKQFNILMDTDSYKCSHWLQYPPGAEALYSYLESRGGKFKTTVFFGLQYTLKEYLTRKITIEMVEEAKEFWESHGEPFNYEGWMYIAKNLDGRIPIRIKAVKEGTVVPTSNVLVTCESTDAKCFWVESWFETMLLRVWYPITVATLSRECKKIIKSALDASSDAPDAELPFKLHDFGSRGVSSLESAMVGGAAHLVNFMGSDTGPGVWMAKHYYNQGKMPAFSIPAAEHSTITSWKRINESAAYRNMLKQYGGQGKILACVSDSFDIFNAITNIWGNELKQEVIDSKATLVIRPDSGDPVDVVLECLKRMEAAFGATTNHKGFKVINHNVRLIQGDGITIETLEQILRVMLFNKYSATNIAFGMGGGLLQQVNRDTQKFAYKASEIVVNGESVPVFKDPVTDPGKRSKIGRLALVLRDGKFETAAQNATSELEDHLELVYENGEIKREETLDSIRERAAV